MAVQESRQEGLEVRHKKGPQADIETLENIGYALGEARDFLDREEVRLLDLLDALEAGKITFIAARLAVRLDFHGPRKDLNSWEKWWGWRAEGSDFPYLHSSLKQDTLPFPSIRLVLPLREPEQPA